MDISSTIDSVWQYSKYYADLLTTILRLHENKESHAAILVLFATMELVFKHIRENDSQTLINDIKWLHDNKYINDDEEKFLNSEDTGVRKIRKLALHKDCYSNSVIIGNCSYLLSDIETWELIYDAIAIKTILIICKVILIKERPNLYRYNNTWY